MLKNEDAAYALWQISPNGPEGKIAVSALIESLEDKQSSVRLGAVYTLGLIGGDAKTSIPTIRTLLNDKDEYVRKAAAEALDQIAPFLPPVPEGKTWKLVWHDEFDGTKLDATKWEVMPDAPRKDGWWMRDAISFNGVGHLYIRTFKEGNRYIDGCVRTKGKFAPSR
jgi:hypothetical protein